MFDDRCPIPPKDNNQLSFANLKPTVALTKSGEIFTFGQNKWGQCGIGEIFDRLLDFLLALIRLF